MAIKNDELMIRKRTGLIVIHDHTKIISAIYRAMQSLGKGNEKLAAEIAVTVENRLDKEFFGCNKIPEVENVQDFVEEALMQFGLFDVAKAFIVYRAERSRIRNHENVVLDVKKTIDQYFGTNEGKNKDWRIKENANQDFDYPGLNVYISGTHLARYGLYSLYPPEVAEAHVTGQIHIHDLSNSIVGYCAGWSLQLLLEKGFGGVSGRISSGPACHLDSVINQMITFLGTLQNEFAGAQAFSSVDTLLSPFIREKFLRSVEKILRQTFSLKVNGCVYELLDMLYGFRKGEITAKDIQEKLESFYPNVIFSNELLQTFLRSFNEEYDDNVYFIRQNIQNLIYALNQTSRWGGQSPFVNLSFDWNVPHDLKDQFVIIRGEPNESMVYGDCQTEMDIFNLVFIQEMLRGDKHNRVFTFPIPTYSITKDFDWTHPNVDLLMKITAKYGIPYFQNYIGSGLEPSSIRAMCCRLNLNLLELKSRPGGMWNIGDSTGSIGVVTINMNRLGYLAVDEDDFFKLLKKYMDLAKISLEIKRKEISRNLENGMMAFAKNYLPRGFQTYFSTIGLCGMHECCLNFLNRGIGTSEGLVFTQKVLGFMRDICDQYKKETGNLYNLEATPAESTSYRFARLDKKYNPNILTSGSTDVGYLTNSTHLPVNATDDLIEAIEHQNQLQIFYTGGSMFHTYLGEEIDQEACKNIVQKIVEKTQIPYFSITPTFSICTDHKYIKGKHYNCPQCGKPTEVYSRIVGYFRPISKWNDGKIQEFKERISFKLDGNRQTESFLSSEEIKSNKSGFKQMNINIINNENRLKEIITTNIDIVVFSSPSCPRCGPFTNLLKRKANGENIRVIDTSSEEGLRLSQELNVQTIPTAIVYRNDEEITRFSDIKDLNNYFLK